MNTLTYILNLLGRLQDTESPEIRQSAYSEAMSLNDSDLALHLQTFLRYEKLPSFRKQAYFCLAYLALNLKRADLVHFLLKQIQSEKERTLQLQMLTWIADVGTKGAILLTDEKHFVESLIVEKKGKMKQLALCILDLYIEAPPKVQALSNAVSPKTAKRKAA